MILAQQQTYELRNYQQELVNEVFAKWRSGLQRIMLQLPTGAGKTVLFSAIAQEFVAKGERVLVLAHREELLTQAQEKLESVTQLPVGIIKAGYPSNPLFPIQVASVATLIRRKTLPEAALVICDEAHHSIADSYLKLFEYYKAAYLLGVTATPARTDGRGFEDIYQDLILGVSVKDLIEQGYLCKYRLFGAAKLIDTSKIKSTAGDYNQKDLANLVNTADVLGDIIKAWEKHALNKQTIVFCVNIEHSQAVAQKFLDSGYLAEHIDGETPSKERHEILQRFRAGETRILTNCGIVSEGFDVPGIEAIQCVRPTQSLILWLQMLGRALRPAPNKEYALIIDHTLNFKAHGLPTSDFQWSLKPRPINNNGKALVVCTKCNHVFRPLHHEQKAGFCDCPNCGNRIELEPFKEIGGYTPREVSNDVEAEIIEITNTEVDPVFLVELQKLLDIQKSRSYKPYWVFAKALEKFPNPSVFDLRHLAQCLGYKQKWAEYKWKELNPEPILSNNNDIFNVQHYKK